MGLDGVTPVKKIGEENWALSVAYTIASGSQKEVLVL